MLMFKWEGGGGSSEKSGLHVHVLKKNNVAFVER